MHVRGERDRCVSRLKGSLAIKGGAVEQPRAVNGRGVRAHATRTPTPSGCGKCAAHAHHWPLVTSQIQTVVSETESELEHFQFIG